MAKKHLPIFGVGPLILGVGACVIGPGLVLYFRVPGSTAFLSPGSPLRVIGAGLSLIGLYFWAATARQILRDVPKGKLITTGLYGLTRNPMYAGIIVFLLPGLGFLLNAWFFFPAALLMALAFEWLIVKEEWLLEMRFGDDYRAYRRKVPRLFPRLLRATGQ